MQYAALYLPSQSFYEYILAAGWLAKSLWMTVRYANFPLSLLLEAPVLTRHSRSPPNRRGVYSTHNELIHLMLTEDT